MKYLFILSGENYNLAKSEAKSQIGFDEELFYERYLIFEKNRIVKNTIKRLALTKEVHKILFVSKKDRLYDNINKFNFNKEYDSNFKIGKVGKGIDKKKVMGLVYKRIKNPKVNLQDTRTIFSFIEIKDKIYALKKIYENIDDYPKRNNKNLPERHPSSLNPKIARAMINITGIKNGTITDPFCGSGGILIEGALMKLKVKGTDIEKIMVNKAKINMKYLKLENYKINEGDALKLKKANYIITDMPYGKNTKAKDIERLYEDFFKVIKNIKPKKSVIGLPDFINYKKILKKVGLKSKEEFLLYIHKSLSKRIVVV